MAMRRKREWFDDDAFWRDLYPFMFPERRFTDTPDQIDKVLSLAQPVGKVVLDLCCGPGRCSIALAKRGYRLEAAGFGDVKLYGTLIGEEYGENAQRLIAVARKPGTPMKTKGQTRHRTVRH